MSTRRTEIFKGIFVYSAAKGRLRRGALFLKGASGARVNTLATVTLKVLR